MRTLDSYSITIYSGLREGYEGKVHPISDAESILQEYCDEVGYCFSLTPTRFIYKGRNEDGVAVGLINYPRFPHTPEQLRDIAINIGQQLMVRLQQNRVSIVCSDKTFLLLAQSVMNLEAGKEV